MGAIITILVVALLVLGVDQIINVTTALYIAREARFSSKLEHILAEKYVTVQLKRDGIILPKPLIRIIIAIVYQEKYYG